MPGFDYPPGYTTFQFAFVLLQSAAMAGVFTGFGIAQDFERGFAHRLLIAAPRRSGIMSATRSRRWCAGCSNTAIVFAVALLMGMEILGGPVDLVALAPARA